MYRWLLLLFVSGSVFFQAMGQNNRLYQETFLEAEYFFFNGDYNDALPFYLQLYESYPDNSNIAYRIGSCYLNLEGQKNLSIQYLESAVINISAKHREGSITQKTAPYDALYELGKAYLVNQMYDKAKNTFTLFSESLLPNDLENIAFINQQIKACEEAKNLISHPISFSLENLGDLINDEKDNFNPVISSDGNTLAFMVSLKFYDAIMISRKEENDWRPPVNITPELETDGDIHVSCLGTDGNILFLSKDDNYVSDIFYSTYNGSKWTPIVKLNKNINTRYWESHAYMSYDESTLIFASNRPGGFGGLDLYISTKTDGVWGPAINMGAEINTPFNEDRPFLLNNGQLLFFISQGHDGMGGYDIFHSSIQSDGIWKKPENPGYPLNNSDDNIFFMPFENGVEGFYSTANEQSGFGGYDIYKVFLHE